MKPFPISVFLACIVLLAFVAVTIYLHPQECAAVVLVVLPAISAIRVAYFVIEGE